MTTLTKRRRAPAAGGSGDADAAGSGKVGAPAGGGSGKVANGKVANGKHGAPAGGGSGKHANGGGSGKPDALPEVSRGGTAAESADWRRFVGRWLEAHHCRVEAAPRGDWEVELSPELQKRWRRQRVRLVFDPARPTVPRGAWFTAPGSAGGRRILEAALAEPLFTRRTALARVPGAPDDGWTGACRVRGLTWGPARLGPVRYERRVAFHAVITRWGGLPWQEQWVVLVGAGGEVLERVPEAQVPEVRPREGLYQMPEELPPEVRERWLLSARATLEALAEEREREWAVSVGRLRDDELDRLGSFFSARIEEEEERMRRRAGHDEHELEHGDATSLKLEWERRAAEVRQRWAMRTEVRLWGIEEWSWPVADLEQELRSGAMRVKVKGPVDVARGRPALPPCPSCGKPAEMLVRARGTVCCASCAPA